MLVPQQSNVSMSRNTSFAQELAEISQKRNQRRSKIAAYPSLSVVIATVRPNDLENILKQMLKQTMPKFEIVLGLHNIDLNIKDGEIVCLMGRNGSGKSTLLSQLVGLLKPNEGKVEVLGKNPAQLQGYDLISTVGLVPQEPTDLLISDSVLNECVASDKDSNSIPGTTWSIFEQLTSNISENAHPRDLSEGEKLSLALAVVLAAKAPLILLDEPTRGLDYAAKKVLVNNLQKLGKKNHTIILATHDVELAAEVATRVILLAEGEIVTDGPVNEVLSSSPMFSPQVSKVLSPAHWLTVSDVAYALEDLT